MKKAVHFKTLLILLMLPALVFSNNNWKKGKHTKEKTIHKEFDVSSDAMVKIDNSYGNLDIVTWDENRVVIDITITTNGNNEDKVQDKLDKIDVDFSASSTLVSAKTRFGKSSKSWFSWGNSNVNMKINYVVKMPITNSVDLENDYGSINLDKLEGKAIINCDYGKITTKELMADNNYIKFDYTQNSYFEYIKSGTIKADYSGYTVANANRLTIDADYTKSHIETAEDVEYNCNYGSLKIDRVNNVTGNGDYLSARLGDVYKDVTIEADYGSLKINRLTENAGDVYIKSDYMKITIGYDSGYNFNFEVDLDYASLRGDEGLEFNKKAIKSTDKYYEGYYGNSSSGNTVKINSDYGSVTFKKL